MNLKGQVLNGEEIESIRAKVDRVADITGINLPSMRRKIRQRREKMFLETGLHEGSDTEGWNLTATGSEGWREHTSSLFGQDRP